MLERKKSYMNKIAVGVGYEFNLFSENQVSHINLAEGNTKVFVNDVSYELHFARTFEDSTKVDSLLDSVGGLKIDDYTRSEDIAPDSSFDFDDSEGPGFRFKM